MRRKQSVLNESSNRSTQSWANKIWSRSGAAVLVMLVGGVFSLAVVANDYGFGERSIFSDRAVAERLKPSAQVCVDGEDCGAAAVAGGDAAGGVAMAADQVYSTNCLACHATGAAGAPKTGDVAAWQARLDDKGLDMLVTNAIQGIGMMPAKGTCASCSEDTIREVVEYILAESK